MPVHKQLFGGDKYLPFALSKLRQLALRAAAVGGYASQTFTVDDGSTIFLRVVQDQHYLTITAPTLVAWTYRVKDEQTVFSLALINPDSGSKTLYQPYVEHYDASYFAVFNALFPVGDGYLLRWQAEGPGFAAATYTGLPEDAFYPVLDRLGVAGAYQFGDPDLPAQGGAAYTTDGCRFYAGEAGRGMEVMASHGLSLVPLGQSDASGEHRWIAMGRIYIGDATDLTNQPVEQYAPRLFAAGTRDKTPYVLGPQPQPDRGTVFSKLYAIGRGVAVMTLAYEQEKDAPALPPELWRTEDFGQTWQYLSVPYLSVKPLGGAADGAILCETDGPSREAILKSVFAPMSADGNTVLWLLPNAETWTGTGWQKTTVVLRSTDAGKSFVPVSTVPTYHYADAHWYRDRVFGENCFWFYGRSGLSDAGSTFNRWITYDAGSTWSMVAAGVADGDYACIRPYVDADNLGRMVASRYVASPKKLQIKTTDGRFDAVKDGATVVGDTFVVPPNLSFTALCAASIDPSRDVIYPALPNLMRL